MNENARTWVAALRSGMYRQGQGRLRAPGGKFCCLGVACDIYKDATGDGGWREDANGYTFRARKDEAFNILPAAVAEWLGLDSPGAHYGGLYGQDSLWSQNDTGTSFADIAAIIESEPEGLFA